MAALRQTLKWVKNVYGGGALYQGHPEGNSETYGKGALLVYDESEDGVVEVARTAGVPDLQNLLGLAQEVGVNDSNNLEVDLLIPRPGDVFECSIASSQSAVVAPTQDMVGDRVGIVKLDTTGGAGGNDGEYVAQSTHTNWAKILNVHPADVVRRGGVANLVAGDRVLIQFLGTILDSDGSRDS